MQEDNLYIFPINIENPPFGKLYFLPKIHKRLHNAPGQPVILNYGTPTEKCPEFLALMQRGWLYIRDCKGGGCTLKIWVILLKRHIIEAPSPRMLFYLWQM